jgi:alpha-amylase/alpha-mannosidase (GH57 family)
MDRYICIHGHFYQPPRENPWLEAVELQDSAWPYHDWNERVTAECYAPNATARILDGEGRIVDIVNNYSRISFNFGPTLLAWMAEAAPDVHAAIVEADRQSRERFSGHGSALAQAYNHVILPLASRRDKVTQVIWGLRDFEHRFGRKPEGLWLPECAADTESLEVLAEQGLRFTLLSPFQARQVRGPGAAQWQDVNGGRLDPSRPYWVNLPSGRKLAVFFYDAPVSRAVAFERLLDNGAAFAARLMDGYDDARDGDQLMHIATDGESYGHHHRFGEMALAFALNHIESNQLARLTNYGEFLERHPPTHEVRLHEPSAWSCSHGVGRWTRDCGCNSGGRPGWHQRWRQPLREALDWLRGQLDPAYEAKAREFFHDPWRARDEYIAVILDRSDESVARFFQSQARRKLDDEELVISLRLLELQRHAMLMFTSCGWFFDELSGLETVQVLQYAGRALQLAETALAVTLEPAFLERLARAPSNLAELRDGRGVYERFVRPAIVDREHLAAHFAVSSLFEDYPDRARIYKFTFDQEHRETFAAAAARLVLGRAKVTFETTRAADVFTYAALHRGDYNVACGLRYFRGETEFEQMRTELSEAFLRQDFAAVTRRMERQFGESHYSLQSLFRDEQRKILEQVLAAAREDLEQRYRAMADQYTPLMRFLKEIGAPMPPALRTAAVFIINTELRRKFERDDPDPDRLRALLEEARTDNVELDREALGYAVKGYLDRQLERLATLLRPGGGATAAAPSEPPIATLARTAEIAAIVRGMDLEVNLWKTQNLYFKLLNSVAADRREQARRGDHAAREWLKHFLRLGEQLGFKVNGMNE